MKADGIGEDDWPGAGNVDAAQRRVERREQLVGGEVRRPRQPVEQRRLSGIGVADEGNGTHRRAPTRAALCRALLPDVHKPLVQHADAFAQQAPVGFELCLAGTP
jgi:hypothetical protein